MRVMAAFRLWFLSYTSQGHFGGESSSLGRSDAGSPEFSDFRIAVPSGCFRSSGNNDNVTGAWRDNGTPFARARLSELMGVGVAGSMRPFVPRPCMVASLPHN